MPVKRKHDVSLAVGPVKSLARLRDMNVARNPICGIPRSFRRTWTHEEEVMRPQKGAQPVPYISGPLVQIQGLALLP